MTKSAEKKLSMWAFFVNALSAPRKNIKKDHHFTIKNSIFLLILFLLLLAFVLYAVNLIIMVTFLPVYESIGIFVYIFLGQTLFVLSVPAVFVNFYVIRWFSRRYSATERSTQKIFSDMLTLFIPCILLYNLSFSFYSYLGSWRSITYPLGTMFIIFTFVFYFSRSFLLVKYYVLDSQKKTSMIMLLYTVILIVLFIFHLGMFLSFGPFSIS